LAIAIGSDEQQVWPCPLHEADEDSAWAISRHVAPEQAILQKIRSSNADLVVFGVERIAGESSTSAAWRMLC
jgi:hypothetical protein